MGETFLEKAEQEYTLALSKLDEAKDEVKSREKEFQIAKLRLEIAKQQAAALIPVDRSAIELSNGSPVTEDHRELRENGQQKAYVVLNSTELAKGFVRPYRDTYRHLACGQLTVMGRKIAETYARDPGFYQGTYCSACRSHFPIGENGEFIWYEMDGTEGPKVGT